MSASQTFEVLTLFPEAVRQFTQAGLIGKAIEKGHVQVHATDYRLFTHDKHRTVDDAPFGGGAGMVMRAEPVVRALEHVEEVRGPLHRVLLTPSAPRFDQRAAERLAQHDRIALICGRYEGIDDRVREHFVDEVLSIGDFVLNGGEVAALCIIEAVARLREGVVGNPESIATESFGDAGPGGPGLEHPQYTRPEEFRGFGVPPVLLSGDHAAIARWRAQSARARTQTLRPDLAPRETLYADTPVFVALPSTLDAAALDALRVAMLGHEVAGVLGIGARDPIEWARLGGGRMSISAFADLRAARRTLKRRFRVAPMFVGLAPPGAAGAIEGAEGWVAEHCAEAQGRGAAPAPVVLVAPGAGSETPDLLAAHYAPRAAEGRPPEPAHAVGAEGPQTAPIPSSDPVQARSGLAPTAAIVDSSQPSHADAAGPATLVARALAELQGPSPAPSQDPTP